MARTAALLVCNTTHRVRIASAEPGRWRGTAAHLFLQDHGRKRRVLFWRGLAICIRFAGAAETRGRSPAKYLPARETCTPRRPWPTSSRHRAVHTPHTPRPACPKRMHRIHRRCRSRCVPCTWDFSDCNIEGHNWAPVPLVLHRHQRKSEGWPIGWKAVSRIIVEVMCLNVYEFPETLPGWPLWWRDEGANYPRPPGMRYGLFKIPRAYVPCPSN